MTSPALLAVALLACRLEVFPPARRDPGGARRP
jgi:hypothetical protein